MATASITVGVLALQGGFAEHLSLLRAAARQFQCGFTFIEVRNKEQLNRCNALVIPGGESTTMAIVAARLNLLEPLRQFVKVERRPVWGTCAGLVMLAESASATKKGGQDLIGGLDIRVQRNSYGRQTESFVADLDLPFLNTKGSDASPFRGVFIRAPIVEALLTPGDGSGPSVEILGRAKRPGSQGDGEQDQGQDQGDVVAVRQGNVLGTSFHPELTEDIRIHVWWLQQVQAALLGSLSSG
ncbi:glutamine amidotransferase subunit pdxT [Thozetella sp. PMI_491]|nr:glutamine amidotransferase subunit pdxT [Thozetella sp. PMI_491]